jgi:Tfp pilus assembly protein PilV
MGRERSGDSGFSLVEVLIAIPLTCVVVLNVASLFTLSSLFTRESRDASTETMLASAKLDELQSIARGDAALAPPDALEHDTAGYSDHVDAAGAPVTSGESPFIRRWTVRSSDLDPAMLVFRVLVTTAVRDVRNRGLSGRAAAVREVALLGGRGD